MDIKLKKRIVGFLLLLGAVLLAIPLFFGRSIPADELKLSGRVPEAPAKPADTVMPLPLQSAATLPATAPESKPIAAIGVDKSVAAEPTLTNPLPVATNAPNSPQAMAANNASEIAMPLPIGSLTAASTSSLPAASAPATVSVQPNPAPTAVPAQQQLAATNRMQTAAADIVATNPAIQPSVPAAVKTPVSTTKTTKPKKALSANKPVTKSAKSTDKAVAAVKPPSKVARPLPPAAEAWVVQLGSFSIKANAEKLMKKLQAQGFAAYTRTTKTASGSWVKVLVGPNLRRSDAENVQKRIEKAFNMQGVIVKAGA